MDFNFKDVELINDEVSFKGFFELRTLRFKHRLYAGGWSRTLERELFLRHRAVGVLLYDPQLDAVALIEQFRVGVLGEIIDSDLYEKNLTDHVGSPWLLELVAGLVDKQESVDDVAKREAEEEAGCAIDILEPIANYYSSPGGSNEYFYLFCGKADLGNVGGIHGLESEGEDIRVQVFTFEQAWQLLKSDQLNNAHTLIAMQWLKLNRERLQSQWGQASF